MYSDQEQVNLKYFNRAIFNIRHLLNNSTDNREILVFCLILYLLEMKFTSIFSIKKLLSILENNFPEINKLFKYLNKSEYSLRKDINNVGTKT